MSLSDKEKIEWFDKTIDWVSQFGTPDDARGYVETCGDAAYDVYFDIVNQYEKHKEDMSDVIIKKIDEIEAHPIMKKKLIDSISDFFMNNTSWMIYKTFSSGGELNENFWDENLSASIMLSVKEGSIDKDMLIGQIREATDAGYLTLANVLEEDEDEYEQLKSMNILAFDITDKGREYIMPYIKDKLTEHFTSIAEKIRSI